MKRRLLILALFLLAVISCRRESLPAPEPVVTVLSSTFYTPEEFAEINDFKGILEENSAAESLLTNLLTYSITQKNNDLAEVMAAESNTESPSWGYRKQVLRYKSTDGAGNPIYLSGIIVYPEGDGWKHSIPNIYIYHHITNTKGSTIPSKSNYPLAGLAANNALFIAFDGQGFGESSSVDQPFIGLKLLAKQAMEGTLAILDFLEDQNVKLKKSHTLYNCGYSQGGGIALALHQAYQCNLSTEDQKRLGPIETVAGAGPCNPAATLDWISEESSLAYSVSIPLSLLGGRATHPELLGDYSDEELFSQKFMESGILEMIHSQKYSAPEINDALQEKVGNTWASIVSPALNDKDSELYKRAHRTVELENVLDGSWRALYPITLYHCKEDNVVPYLNSEQASRTLGPQLDLITPTPVPGVEPHYSAVINFATKLLNL